MTELAEEDWIVGKGLRGDPQFGAWPTLPEIAAVGVPADIVTVRVDAPAWLGRSAVAVTRAERPATVDAVVVVLREVARGLRP